MRWKVMAVLVAVMIFAIPVYGAGGGVVQVIRSDDQEVILELAVPGFQVQPSNHEGVTYHRVTIPNFSLTTEVGHPQLPVRGEVIGIPEGARAIVEVLAADYKVHPNYQIAPVPRPVVDEEDAMRKSPHFIFSKDETIYTRDAFYPSQPVQMGFTGRMRDQEVVQVLFHPIQTNPARRELRFYHRILVRIGFDTTHPEKTAGISGSSKPQVIQQAELEQGRVNDTPYEQVLKDLLLNYPELRGK